jgi:sporulation protein YlmC with PRC-barrel domain
MRMNRYTALAALVAGALLTAGPAAAQTPAPPAKTDGAPGLVDPFSHDMLYRGWRSRQIAGQRVTGRDGADLGTVRDLVVDADGRLAALVVEGGGIPGVPDAVYRVPWSGVDTTPGREGVAVAVSRAELPTLGLFPGSEGVATLPREFRASEVVGDYARLQTGYGFGVVTDVVFGSDGRMLAVLVSRDAAAGGGAYAFAYPAAPSRWDPAATYYGLPYVTPDQAAQAGLRVDPKRFENAAL